MNIVRAKDFNDAAMLDAPIHFTIVADLGEIGEEARRAALPELMMAGVRFIDFRQFYEDVFDRIPLSALDDGWFWKVFQSA